MADNADNGDHAFMKIYNRFCRTSEYLTFLRSPEASVYYFLRSAIIRESDLIKNNFAHKAYVTYKTYFIKGSLVSRYSIKNIAEYNGTSESSIVSSLKLLEEDGFIEIIQVSNEKGTKFNYYKLGSWTGEVGSSSYTESYCLDKHFDIIYSAKRTKRDNMRKFEAHRNLMKTCHSFDHFIMLVGDDVNPKYYDYLQEVWDELGLL